MQEAWARRRGEVIQAGVDRDCVQGSTRVGEAALGVQNESNCGSSRRIAGQLDSNDAAAAKIDSVDCAGELYGVAANCGCKSSPAQRSGVVAGDDRTIHVYSHERRGLCLWNDADYQ